NTRGSDTCGRLGGDEFLLVITHVPPAGIDLAVNRLREKFCELSFPFVGKSIKVTASFGAAGFQGKDPRDFRELLRKADEMLYAAKRNGRNCLRTLDLSECVRESSL